MEPKGIKIRSIITGLLVIAAGVLLYLFNTGILPVEYKSVVFSWQSLLVAIGFVQLFSRCKWIFGLILMLIGGFFLLQKLHLESLAFLTQNAWPIGLVIVGLIIIFHTIWRRSFSQKKSECYEKFHRERKEWRKSRPNGKSGDRNDQTGYIDRNYVFSGDKEKIDTQNFKGGEINCVFGGMELDLTDAQLADGINTLEINTVFGGLVLYVPVDWHIEIRQSHVFGHFADNRPKPGFEIDEKKTLRLQVSAVFGGGEIKCKNE